jgi:hypothetical protein
MILIAHRGNINGRFESYENEPMYIDLAISKGYDVEIDVWYKDGLLFLGHDEPQYGVDFKWFVDRINKLWVHCKNIEAVNYFQTCDYKFNYFWHENDTITLTSLNNIWAFPGKQPIQKSIAVMPEIFNDDLSLAIGICSDFIEKYK